MEERELPLLQTTGFKAMEEQEMPLFQK